MDTSSLVPELLIIGLQAYVWIYFLIITIRKDDWLVIFSFNNEGVAIIFGLVAFAYALGLIIDLFSSLLINYDSKVSLFIRSRLLKSEKIIYKRPIREELAYIRARKADTYSEIEKLVNRAKLLRANFFNMLLIGIIVIIYCMNMELSYLWIITITIAMMVIIILSIIAWLKNAESCYFHIDMTYRFLEEDNN